MGVPSCQSARKVAPGLECTTENGSFARLAALRGGCSRPIFRSHDRVPGDAEHNWADALDVMGWSVDPQGFGVILARAGRPSSRSGSGRRSTACSSGSGSRARTIGRFVCHPGGTKVVAAIERALSLDNGALDHEPLHRLSLAVVPLAGMPRNLFGCEGMNLGPPECSGV